ncbi:MAG: hypothetical protein ACF8TS_10315 [Maioricimonas sp. JB049]
MAAKSIKPREWGFPEPVEKGSGQAGDRWRYADLLPILRRRYPTKKLPETLPPPA